MFSSSKKNDVQSTRVDTLIGASTSISGNINASGIIRIDGNYTGDINTESQVIVGEGGFVKGDITADMVSISGTVEGNIKCRGVLEILESGKLLGDIEVNKVSINDGAVFNGKCSMVSEKVMQIAEPQEVIEEN